MLKIMKAEKSKYDVLYADAETSRREHQSRIELGTDYFAINSISVSAIIEHECYRMLQDGEREWN